MNKRGVLPLNYRPIFIYLFNIPGGQNRTAALRSRTVDSTIKPLPVIYINIYLHVYVTQYFCLVISSFLVSTSCFSCFDFSANFCNSFWLNLPNLSASLRKNSFLFFWGS